MLPVSGKGWIRVANAQGHQESKSGRVWSAILAVELDQRFGSAKLCHLRQGRQETASLVFVEVVYSFFNQRTVLEDLMNYHYLNQISKESSITFNCKQVMLRSPYED